MGGRKGEWRRERWKKDGRDSRVKKIGEEGGRKRRRRRRNDENGEWAKGEETE